MRAIFDYFHHLASSLPDSGPGFSAVVLQDGRPAFELHHGMASVELQVPLSGESAYYLASESKQFTAACVMIMVKDGLMGLDDDVVPHLPELAALEQPIPLKSLLNHTSGIPDYLRFIHCQLGRHESDYFGTEHILRLIACFDELDFPTSTKHGYSNSNYILLAVLLERVTGVDLASFARDRLFQPVGMKATRFDADRFSILPNRVCSYEKDPARPMGLRQLLGNSNTVGDGGVYSSTNELIRWEQYWHRNRHHSSSLIGSLLQTSGLVDQSTISYRFGLEVCASRDEEYVYHSGGFWGFRTVLLRLPQRGISVIHLANFDEAAADLHTMLDCLQSSGSH